MVKDSGIKYSDYISVEEIYHKCNAPGPCGEKMACEGKMSKIKGYIDYHNIFDKKHYPQLPYEKFKIFDEKGKSLEVWAVSDDNRDLFEKIYQNKSIPEKMIFIKGVLVGVDMPIMGTCHRNIRIDIEKADDIFFAE